MNKFGPLDPRIDKLVALLYGELPETEAREVRAMIEADPGLRHEWEELQGTREMLRKRGFAQAT
jgi:anti-sigma factor RsiW